MLNLAIFRVHRIFVYVAVTGASVIDVVDVEVDVEVEEEDRMGPAATAM